MQRPQVPRRQPLRGALAAVAVGALALVGCGDDGGSTLPGAGDDGGAAPAEPSGDAIKIGVAYPDLEAFSTLNEKFSIGDPRQQAEAVLDGWRRDGRLPVHGQEIEFVYRKYNIISDDDKLGACTGFAQDDGVFAVIAGRDFTTGATCLASRFDIPVIDLNAAPASTYAQGAPWFFTIRTNETTLLRAFAAWGDENGHFDGRRVGIFWDTRSEESVEAFKDELAARGHDIVAEISSSGEGVGSPQDQIAVQRFADEDVDLAVLLVGGSSVSNFMTFADRQDYEPDYLDLDFAGHVGDVASSALNADQYDGTLAMTVSRVGELAAGIEPNDAARSCIENYERFSGTDIEVTSPESGEYVNTLYTCDLASVLLAGLEGAGDDLTRQSFVAALEDIDDLELAAWSDVDFSSDDHSGASEYRTIQWTADCACWTIVEETWTPITAG